MQVPYDHPSPSLKDDEVDPANNNPDFQTNQRGDEPTTPQVSRIPVTSSTFPCAVIPYHALIGNINDETTAAIEGNPTTFLAIVSYGGPNGTTNLA
jgi:hypothetical protein